MSEERYLTCLLYTSNIYGDEDYQPSQTVMDNEEKTYKTYGEFKK